MNGSIGLRYVVALIVHRRVAAPGVKVLTLYLFISLPKQKWYGYPDEENNLQLAEDMGNSADVVNSFWHDVGTEKCDLSQYPKEELETLRLLSSITWRSKLFYPSTTTFQHQ